MTVDALRSRRPAHLARVVVLLAGLCAPASASVAGESPATDAPADSLPANTGAPADAATAADGASPAREQLRYDLNDDIRLELGGYYRFRVTDRTEMLLSEIPFGARAGERVVSESQVSTEHRLRLEPVATFYDQASVHLQLDVFTGMLSGDTSGREYMYFAQPPQRLSEIDGGDFDDFVPTHLRQIYGQWNSPAGRLVLGRTGSDWGLGLLASNGGDAPRTHGRNDFGDAYYGDIVDRALFATKPLSVVQALAGGQPNADADPLVLAFAYDWNVVRDSLVRTEQDKRDLLRASTPGSTIELVADPEDDDAHQWIGAVRVDTQPFEGGFYAARRELERQDVLVPPGSRPRDEFLRVWAFDAYAKLDARPAFLGGGSLYAESELAFVTGETNLTVSRVLQSPNTPFPASDVEQLGVIARGGVLLDSFDLILEGGYASGDADPFDDEVRNFRFHPDLNVGLILFESLLAETSATSARNAVLVFGEGGPVRTLGADLLATNGGVTNAVFLSPRVRIRPWSTLEGVLGVLWARTATDYVDPANDFIQSGAFGLFNPFGAPSSNRELGVEIDLALRYTFEPTWSSVEVGLEYGHLFPGNVFENVDGDRMDDVDLVRGRLTFRL